MKKRTAYTLLCTTIMIPGLSLAMEGDPLGSPPPTRSRSLEPATPIRDAEKEIENVKKNIGPSTPDIIFAAKRTADSTTYNPRLKEMFVKAQVQMDKAARDSKRDSEISKIETKRDQEMQNRILQKEEKFREAEKNRLQALLQDVQEHKAQENEEKEALKNQVQALETNLVELREQKTKAKEEYEKEKAELNKQYTQEAEVLGELLEQLTKSYAETTQRLEEKETEKRQALEELHKVKLAKETAEFKGKILEEGIKNLAFIDKEPEKVDSSKPTSSTSSVILATPALASSSVATMPVPDNASKDPAPKARKTLGKADFGGSLVGAVNKGGSAGEERKEN